VGRVTARRYQLPLVITGITGRTLSLLCACLLALGVIFGIDVEVPSDVVIASLYVLPTLLAARNLPGRAAVAIWLCAMMLQLAALLLQRSHPITAVAEGISVTLVFFTLRSVRLSRFRKGALGRRSSVASKDHIDEADPQKTLEPLTKREREVVRLAADGLSAKEIAHQLSISRRTVETHLAHTYAKLGVESKVQLILKQDWRPAGVKGEGGNGL
jgi:DNA-binding CsgD family transcriptional regulator